MSISPLLRLTRLHYRWLLLALLTVLPASAIAADCVALLHGLWRTEHSMDKLATALDQAGYAVHNIHYDSTKYPIEELALEAVPRAIEACKESPVIHFVTHSMGGILVRYYLQDNDIPNLGRVVMLGPPNHGSQIIDRYGHFPGFAWFSGPAGLQLGTGTDSVPHKLGPAHFDLGVIAGTHSMDPILSQTLPGPDDGKVSVESTQLEGMRDHLEMPVTHMFMMRDDEVIRQVLYYLAKGRFFRIAEYAAPATSTPGG